MAKKYWGYFTQIAFLAFFPSPHVAKKGTHTFFWRQGVFCIPHQCSTDNLMTHSFRYCEIRNKITRSKPIQVERSSCFYPNKYTCTRSSKLLHCASKSRVCLKLEKPQGHQASQRGVMESVEHEISGDIHLSNIEKLLIRPGNFLRFEYSQMAKEHSIILESKYLRITVDFESVLEKRFLNIFSKSKFRI